MASTTSTARTLTLTDGRDLTYDVYGDPDGMPVIFSHGFCDSRLIRNPDEALTASLGVMVVAADQPGVGGSSPQPGRRMVDWGADMEQLADELGLDTFAVAGHSGGGPHTLSLGVRMPDRVTHGVLASPVGPLDREGSAKMLVMRDLKLVVRLRDLHNINPLGVQGRRQEGEEGRRWLRRRRRRRGTGPMPPRCCPTRPSARCSRPASPRASCRTGNGMYEMTMALWDWGFELADVAQPFDVFHGDADDVISPQMPAHVAEQLPQGSPHVWPGAGHYGFVDRERWTQFLGALTAR